MDSEMDGVEYLRRLRQNLEGAQRFVTGPPIVEQELHGGHAERRAVPRFTCQGSAQVRREHSQVHTWASITDISMHGCYLEMASTFPVGTIVHVQIELVNVRVNLKGEVRATYPFLGMGIAFRDVPEEEHMLLTEIVNVVMRDARLVAPKPQAAATDWEMPKVSNPERALELIGAAFETRTMLTRNELTRILQSLSGSG
jgi:hypothetical protein